MMQKKSLKPAPQIAGFCRERKDAPTQPPDSCHYQAVLIWVGSWRKYGMVLNPIPYEENVYSESELTTFEAVDGEAQATNGVHIDRM